MTRLLTTVITPPEYVRVKKSSLTFGYASRLFNLLNSPSIVLAVTNSALTKTGDGTTQGFACLGNAHKHRCVTSPARAALVSRTVHADSLITPEPHNLQDLAADGKLRLRQIDILGTSRSLHCQFCPFRACLGGVTKAKEEQAALSQQLLLQFRIPNGPEVVPQKGKTNGALCDAHVSQLSMCSVCRFSCWICRHPELIWSADP